MWVTADSSWDRWRKQAIALIVGFERNRDFTTAIREPMPWPMDAGVHLQNADSSTWGARALRMSGDQRSSTARCALRRQRCTGQAGFYSPRPYCR